MGPRARRVPPPGPHPGHGAGARDGGSHRAPGGGAGPGEGGGDHRWPSPGAGAEPAWLERERGDGGPDLVDTLVADLAAGLRDLLSPYWARIERDPAQAGRTSLDTPVRDLLDEVHGRLLRDAATSPPPYDRHPERRPDAARLTGVASDRVSGLLAPGGDGVPTVPLCGPQHRRLLSADPQALRRVRFAPEAFRRGAADRDAPSAHPEPYPYADHAEDVVWTPAGRHAGVLHLVPLRHDAVRTVREASGEGQEGRPS
ncbi:hypothetical protein [Streptomyces sp. CC210A]|uniref:hypothetical protein n=1 Tax=Streptomyces sp. CC210A TaxID=2898184 RepID=UPI001F1E29F8|nr:hypothetical protein [Streptomyces sp. CC210A]